MGDLLKQMKKELSEVKGKILDDLVDTDNVDDKAYNYHLGQEAVLSHYIWLIEMKLK